ncbi:MAG: peptidylprolyl isomerase [Oscillospiraceae bacterium]
MKKALALVLACLLLAACSGAPPSSEAEEPAGAGGSTRRDAVQSGVLQFTTPAEGDMVAAIETALGTIRLVLYPQHAPLAVENFCTLAQRGWYDGAAFHRVVAGFVVQAGDKDGTGLSGESIWGVPFATERSDKLHHYAGALCMAAADGQPDTHESQFYVVACAQDSLDEAALEKLAAAGLREEVVEAYRQAGGAPYLDNTDTVFGQVYAGMDVVDKIAALPADEEGRPKEPLAITRITVETYGNGGQNTPAPEASQPAPPASENAQSTAPLEP